MNNRKLAVISIILAGIFFGGNSVFSKIALHTAPPLTFTFLRFLVGSFAITPFLLKEKGRKNRPTVPILLLSLIQVANVTFFSLGVRLTTAVISQTLYTAAPIFTIIISYILLKERITSRKLLGIAVGFLGTIIIILLPFFGKPNVFNGNFIGNTLILVSVICLATYSLLSKQFHDRYSPVYLTALFIYLTTLVIGILSIPELINNVGWWRDTPPLAWFGILYVGIPGVLAFLLYQFAIKHSTAVMASMITYISPVIAFMFAAILLGEKLTLSFLIGTSLVFIGVYIVTTGRTSQNKLPQ